MVSYPDLSSISSDPSIGNFLSLPNASYPFYWAWILGGIWFIMTLTMYYKEKERVGKSRVLSSMSVASFAIIILALIGSVAGFITLEIMVYTMVLSFLITAVWFFTER